MPPVVTAVPAAAAPLSAAGPPVSHGGYASGRGSPAPTSAESAGHEARARSASKSLEKSHPSAASSAAGSRAEGRERSPRGQSAIAAALAAEVADVEAEAERHASTDAYMPAAGAISPEDDAGPPSTLHSSYSAHSAGFGPPGSVSELQIQVATTAALLRMAIDAGPASGVDAARADAADAEAALAAAMARPGGHPVRPLPQSLKPIYKAPPPEAYLPRAAGPPQPADGAAAAAPKLAEVPAPPAGVAAGAPDAPPGSAPASPGDAAAIPVAGPGRGPAARRPSLGGKGGTKGEVGARRGFIESAFTQADVGNTLDGRGLAAQGFSGDDSSAVSDI